MSVKVNECTMVRPAKQTPRHSLWLSRLDMYLVTPFSHAPAIHIFTPSETLSDTKFFDPQILKAALSKVLVSFYPVAGRLKRNKENNRLEIDCNDEGVLFEDVETKDYSIVDFEGGFKITNDEFRKLVVPTCDYSHGLSSFPLLMVRLTRFKCGGVCLAFGAHHHVTDGIGYVYFTNSWARLAMGLELVVQPIHDREAYVGPRVPPQVLYHHVEFEPPLPPLPPKGISSEMSSLRECMFTISKCQIDALKLQATSQLQNYKLSTFEILAGHIWRSACRARDLRGDDQLVKLYIPTDGRSRFKDPTLPQGYFGNVVIFTSCVAKASDITQNPNWYSALEVHKALQKLQNMEYLKSTIDYLESQPDVAKIIRGPYSSTCPNLTINSWGRLPFHDTNFGWGQPNFAGRGGIECEGQSYIYPNSQNDGSFSINIKLFNVHVMLFEKYFQDVNCPI